MIQAEEAAQKATSDLAAARHTIAQLEGAVRARERDVERGGKALDAARAMAHEATVERAQVGEAVREDAEPSVLAIP